MHRGNYERQQFFNCCLIISLITRQETESASRDTQISRIRKVLKQTFYLNPNLEFIRHIIFDLKSKEIIFTYETLAALSLLV